MINLHSIKQTPSHILRLSATILTVAVLGSSLVLGSVHADQYDEKIRQLQAQNDAIRAQSNSLAREAASFEEKIQQLAGQISSLENQIKINEARRQQLLVKINVTQQQIDAEKNVLKQNIRAMYLEDEISTFEILASSNNLGKFVDKEQYRNEVKDKITATIKKINELKQQLDAQKTQVETVINDQKNVQSQLATQRAEQARLLAMNQAERGKLNAELNANSSKISKLRSEQAAANARLFGNGVVNKVDGSGYPWAGVPFPNEMADPWGMYKRQCVSYTAWKVAASGRHMPHWGGRGNANQWDDNARAAGIPVDGNPRVGDVAVSNSGYYGHVMYVEAVYGDGTIYVSQYNAGWDGRYSEAKVSAAGLVFIHF